MSLTPSTTRARRRGRRTATVATTAVVAALGAAWPTSAHAATTPTTTVVVPAYINAAGTMVTISGVADPGDSIAIAAVDSLPLFLATEVDGTATAGSTGAWSVTLDLSSLADGTVTIDATPSMGTTAGTAAEKTSEKDTAAPGAPAKVTPTPAPYVTATDPLTVAGTTATADGSDSTLTADVTVADAAGRTLVVTQQKVTASSTGLSGGTFTAAFPAAQVATLADGKLTVSAVLHDAAGNASPATTGTDEKGKLALASTSPVSSARVSSPSRVSATYNQALSASGTGTTSSLAVKDSAGTAVTGTSAASGSTVTFTPAATLPDGTYTATATVYDAAYTTETSTDSFTFTVSAIAAPAAPVISAFTDPVNTTNAATVVVSGTADLTTRPVSVSVGAIVHSVTPGTDHTWTSTFDLTAVADGALTARATQTDASGRTSSVATRTSTKDTVAPKPTSATPADGYTVTSADSVAFAFDQALGTGSVTVTRAGSSTAVGGATSTSGSSVTFTPSSALADGTYTAAASVTDAAGNPASSSTTFTVAASAKATSTTLTAPATVAYGKPITLRGAVSVTGGAATGSVHLTARSNGGTVVDLGSVTLGSGGSFAKTLKPSVDAIYQATYSGSSGSSTDTPAASSASPARRTDVALKITASSKTGKHTSKAIVNGHLSPVAKSTQVVLYVTAGGKLKKIGTTRSDAQSRFRFAVKLAKGTHVLTLRCAATANNAAGTVQFNVRRT